MQNIHFLLSESAFIQLHESKALYGHSRKAFVYLTLENLFMATQTLKVLNSFIVRLVASAEKKQVMQESPASDCIT